MVSPSDTTQSQGSGQGLSPGQSTPAQSATSTKGKTSKDKDKEKDKDKDKEKDKEKPPTIKLTPEKAFLKEALEMASHIEVDRVLFVFDVMPPIEDLKKKRSVRKKLVVATPSEKIGARCEEEGIAHEIIPAYAFDRFDKIKISLAACVTSNLLTDGMTVLCIAGKINTASMDTCMLTRIGDHSEESSALGVLQAGSEFSAQVLECILNLALNIGYEGFEGSPVGTIFVVGDTVAVMEKSKQLTLNPFQGYSESEKNILDPKVRDAIRNYALLDGAIIVREDGVVLAAGRYLRTSEDLEVDLPLGLGARNAAALLITKTTKAITFLVSKTNGAIRIFKDGMLAVEFKQPHRRTL
jgi:diadenylate cyclase